MVDLETGPATDPGPCVELARARRLEQVSYQIVQDTMNQVQTMACTQPCDADPREPDKAQNSAAYLELTGQIPGRHHPRRFGLPAGSAVRSAPGGARDRRRDRRRRTRPLAPRDRLRVVAVARGVLVRKRRAPRRVLRGRPLPPAARRQLPAPLLRAPAARLRARVRVGMLTGHGSQARRPQARRRAGRRRSSRRPRAGSASTCYNGRDALVRRRGAGPDRPHDDDRARRDHAHSRRHPRVPAGGVAAARAGHPAAGRLRARVGPRRRARAGSGRHRQEAGRPSRAAALRRLAVPEGDRAGCWTSATSCA